jgi:tetratricopeptide (TPR) repeat protein
VEALKADPNPPGAKEADAVEQARARVAAAEVARRAGRYDRAEELVEQAETALDGIGYLPAQAEVALVRANVLDKLGRFEEAATSADEALRMGMRARRFDTMQQAAVRLLAVLGDRLGRPEEGLHYRAMALELADDAEAEGDARNALSLVLDTQGEVEEAFAEMRRAVALWEEALGRSDPKVAGGHLNLGVSLVRQERLEEAEREYGLALDLARAALGPDHPHVGYAHLNRGVIAFERERYEEAGADFSMALKILEPSLGSAHPSVAKARLNAASVLGKLGKPEESIALLRDGIQIMEKAFGSSNPDVALAHRQLYAVLFSMQRFAEAEVEVRRALDILQEVLAPDHEELVGVRLQLVEALLEQDKLAEALPVAEQTWAVVRVEDDAPKMRAQTAFALAQCLGEAGPEHRARALELAGVARESVEAASGSYATELEEIERWIRLHEG